MWCALKICNDPLFLPFFTLRHPPPHTRLADTHLSPPLQQHTSASHHVHHHPRHPFKTSILETRHSPATNRILPRSFLRIHPLSPANSILNHLHHLRHLFISPSNPPRPRIIPNRNPNLANLSQQIHPSPSPTPYLFLVFPHTRHHRHHPTSSNRNHITRFSRLLPSLLPPWEHGWV